MTRGKLKYNPTGFFLAASQTLQYVNAKRGKVRNADNLVHEGEVFSNC